MQRPRAGSALGLRGPSPEPAAEPRLGGSPAAMGVTAPAGSPPARSQLNSAASTAERRRSVVVLAPPEAPERGSALPGTAASGASSGHKADGPHPGLTRLTSFMRRKSTLRGKMSSIQELSAAMDSLDQRIVGALEQLRQQNATGLGHIRALHRTKSGRLAPNRSGSSKEALPSFSPRALLGGAVDDPAMLQRLKFHADEQQALHDGGLSSARGRLEGDPPAAETVEGEEIEGVATAPRPLGLDKKRHTVAVPGSGGGPKWGATEGGRDTLGWVRSLVQFTEAQPFMDPAAAGAKPDGATVAEGEGARPQTGATTAPPRPSRREDVLMLQTWLQEMMAQTLAQVGSRGADASSSDDAASDAISAVADKPPAELADAALWVYGVAFEELQRQVATESRDRAELLSAMWEHCFSLVELRCSLTYEEVIGGIKQELQSARKHRQQLQAQVKTLEATVADSMFYDKERYLEMQAENKRMSRLLGDAEVEAEEVHGRVVELQKALEVEKGLKAVLETELHESHHQKDALTQQVASLSEQVAQQAGTIASHEGDIAQLRGDLQHARSQERQLSEDKARLEVDVKRTQRDLQQAEILGMSLKEQLAARNAELAQLRGEHGDLQQRHAATGAELEGALGELGAVRREHEVSQRAAAEARADMQRSIDGLQALLKDTTTQLGALQLEKQGVDNALKESTARENVASAQLCQLTAAHEQQGTRLRQEAEARKSLEDELQALRAGLQVSQQRLEGLGVVFASSTVHHTAAQAWLATGPLSMGRQVVAAVNQQFTELVAKQQSLQHDLGVAQEHWKAEEGVRIRLQEQLLEAKAQLSKVSKDKEAQEALAARLEQQRNTLDGEVTQMRKLVADAEGRAQAAHKKSLDAVAEAKRLQPLEGKVARLEEQLQNSKADVCRVQQEVAAHQSTIRKLLDEKAAALEELAQRSQALDAAGAEIRQLTAASKDREQLQASNLQLQSDVQQRAQRQAAQEAVLAQSMQQLAVARQLLQEFSVSQEHAKLNSSEGEVRRLERLATSKSREVELLQQRLGSTEQQLQFMERQLKALVAAPASGTPSRGASPATGSGPSEAAQQLGLVVEQLQRVLEVKEDRIRQLERQHSSSSTCSSELRQLQGDVAARDAEVARLRKELEQLRKKLQGVQEERMNVATRDLITMAADARLPQELVKEMLHSYVHNHLRSDLIWAKAKLAVVTHLAKRLRAKLAAEQAARAQAELESVCVEAFYLQQGVLDQRAAAALFDTTFGHVKQGLVASLAAVAELRQLVGPEQASLERLRQQLAAASAGLNHWLDNFAGRQEKGLQSDRQELEPWRQVVEALPEQRPASLALPAEVATTIVHIYAHSVESMQAEGRGCRPSDTLFDAAAAYYMERHGCSRAEAGSATGPVAALLAGARAHQHRPKQLLFSLLAGLGTSVAAGGGGLSLPEGAWRFFVQLLQCIARLHGASWAALAKEWAEAEEGVGLPLPCVMDVLANCYNTDAPALLDCVRRGLVPLIRQGRRGPGIDLDAFLLVMLHEFAEGRCPVDPLALPRRLTDGSLPNALNYHANPPALPSLGAVASVVAATGLADPYASAALAAGAAGSAPEGWRQKSPMRKRIVNLTATSPPGSGGGDLVPLQPGAAALGPAAAGVRVGPGAGSPGGSPGTGGRPLGAPRSPEILRTLQELAAANPNLPLGVDSQLRRSAPSGAAPRS